MKKTSTIFVLGALLLPISACDINNTNTSPTKPTKPTKESATITTIPSGTGIINISSSQLELLLNNKEVTVVDISRPDEWEKMGTVPGSKKLTFFFEGKINPTLVSDLTSIVPNDQPIALICSDGRRTQIAAQILNSQLGYKTIYNVTHGITEWIGENRKTVK